jgi:hypothetical protein
MELVWRRPLRAGRGLAAFLPSRVSREAMLQAGLHLGYVRKAWSR